VDRYNRGIGAEAEKDSVNLLELPQSSSVAEVLSEAGFHAGRGHLTLVSRLMCSKHAKARRFLMTFVQACQTRKKSQVHAAILELIRRTRDEEDSAS
jgi:hypothetical protein